MEENKKKFKDIKCGDTIFIAVIDDELTKSTSHITARLYTKTVARLETVYENSFFETIHGQLENIGEWFDIFFNEPIDGIDEHKVGVDEEDFNADYIYYSGDMYFTDKDSVIDRIRSQYETWLNSSKEYLEYHEKNPDAYTNQRIYESHKNQKENIEKLLKEDIVIIEEVPDKVENKKIRDLACGDTIYIVYIDDERTEQMNQLCKTVEEVKVIGLSTNDGQFRSVSKGRLESIGYYLDIDHSEPEDGGLTTVTAYDDYDNEFFISKEHFAVTTNKDCIDDVVKRMLGDAITECERRIAVHRNAMEKIESDKNTMEEWLTKEVM